MSATVKTYVYTGTAPGSGAAATKIRFKLEDNNTIDAGGILKIPSSGSRYSFWKSIALYAETAPDSFINNLKIYVDGTKLYGVSQTRINAFDVNDPFNMATFATTIPTTIPERPWLCRISGNYLASLNFFDGSGEDGVWELWNISDLSTITLLSSTPVVNTTPGALNINTNCHDISITENYVIVSGYTDYDLGGPIIRKLGIWVYDITDPENPTVTENYFNSDQRRTAHLVNGDYLFLGKLKAGFSNTFTYFQTYDVSALPLVTFLAQDLYELSLGDDGRGQIVVRNSRDYAYLSRRDSSIVDVIDISTPASPSRINTITNLTWNPLGLTLIGDEYLVVPSDADAGASVANSIFIYDLSDPASPSLISSLKDDVDLKGARFVVANDTRNVLYVSCSLYPPDSVDRRLTSIDISDIENPTILDSISATQGIAGLDSVIKLGWKNCSLFVGDETSSTYVQATGDSTSGDEIVASHSEITGRTDMFTYLKSSPKSVSGSIGAATGRISDFVVLQVEVSSGAIFGVKNEEALIWQFDEA